MTGLTRRTLATVGAMAVIATLTTTAASAGSYEQSGAKGDIVDTAIATGSFSTLVKAVQSAGLVDTLKGPGPFTVFAPTDRAFSRVPKAQLEALLADRQALTELLTYHVVPGKVMAADVANLSRARTLQGELVQVSTRGGVRINGAKVVKADVRTTNGVIHVIGTVIVPQSVMATLERAGRNAGDDMKSRDWENMFLSHGR